MSRIDDVRNALAMREAGYDVKPFVDDVSELLYQYDRLASTVSRMTAEKQELVEVLKAVSHTILVHGKVDHNTPLHDRIDAVLAKHTGPLT